jgi:hypothetical protein
MTTELAESAPTKERTTRVYRFGARAPFVNNERVWGQMRAAHRYYNVLIEIEKGRRAAARAALEADPGLAEAYAALRAASEVTRLAAGVIAKQKQEAADRRGATPEAIAAVIAAREVEKDAYKAFYKSLSAAQKAVRPQLDEIAEKALELGRSARKHCGVYWGTYLLVEAAVKAMKTSMPLYDRGAPNDPHFKYWDGEGRIGIHIQGEPLTTEDVFGEGTSVRLVPAVRPTGCDPNSKRSRRRQYLNLMIRVGSEGRMPIWAVFPIVMHRPLPVGHVTWATVSARNIGPHTEWSVQFTVDAEREAMQTEKCGTGKVALDLGWRARPDGSLRAAMWMGDDGREGEITVPASIRDELSQCDALRARRDTNFNVATAELAQNLATVWTTVPAWLVQATKFMAQWRSQARLLALALRWKDNRFEGDAEAFSAVWAWRKQELHLWSWEAHQRQKALRHRQDIYRNAGATLSRQYGQVVFEAFDIRDVAERPAPEAPEDERSERARANRQRAAVSELRLVTTQAFLARGGTAPKRNPAYTTKTCNGCGSIEEVSPDLMHTCSSCGRVWDQDLNAAANLLDKQRAADQSGNGETPDPPSGGKKKRTFSVSKGEQWKASKQAVAERRARLGATREAVPKTAP